MRIVALTTCHNRREVTLHAVESLSRQELPIGCSLEVCVVDDGSSDGTGDALRTRFPGLTVLDGPGDLFWAGGMRFGWSQHVSMRNPDHLLVFNDDIDLFPGAVATLLRAAADLESQGCTAYAVSGAFVNPDMGETAYGGVVRSSRWHPLRFRKLPPSDRMVDCDTLNMNFALISRGALRQVGFLAPDFIHAKADYDFGLRLRRAGGRVVLAPGYVGACETNSLTSTSAHLGLGFLERWRRLTGVKEQPPRERATYFRRHGGRLWPLLWALPYVRVALESGLNVLRRSFSRGLDRRGRL